MPLVVGGDVVQSVDHCAGVGLGVEPGGGGDVGGGDAGGGGDFVQIQGA